MEHDRKDYGHNSKLGATFVLSADTGEVLDYVIKSTYCKECQHHQNDDIGSKKYKNWKENHNCGINDHGSAEDMEKDSAAEMFCRSVEKHDLRYTVYIGYGNTSSFGEVKEALYNKFQNDYPVKKEDCHVQKRMGSALHIYKNKCHGSKLLDEKRLVVEVVSPMQLLTKFRIIMGWPFDQILVS